MASKECQSNEQKGIQFCIFIILDIKETQETFIFLVKRKLTQETFTITRKWMSLRWTNGIRNSQLKNYMKFTRAFGNETYY